MSELRTYHGPVLTDPDPGKEYHYGCRGEVLTFKDGAATCMKCHATADPDDALIDPDSPVLDGKPQGDDSVCDHGRLLNDECHACWEDGKKVAVENPTYEICEHHVLLHEECYLCKGETSPTAVDKCNGTHPVQGLKYVGTLELLICLDRACAHITAKCTHQTPIPESEDTVPRKYTTSGCKWNEDGTVLTCTFCGKDGT